jgi:hypothetical protein
LGDSGTEDRATSELKKHLNYIKLDKQQMQTCIDACEVQKHVKCAEECIQLKIKK